MRWCRVLPLMALVVLVLATSGAQAASVELVSVVHPDPVVFDREYAVNATVRNSGSETVPVSLFTVLYEPDGSPCGPAGGSDYHGRVSMYTATAEVPPGATVHVPGAGASPWWHHVNASNRVESGGGYEVCVFLEDRRGTTADQRYLDHEVQRVQLRMTNEAPRGSFTVTPEEGTTDTVFEFTASATDPEGDEVSFHWDLNDHDASGWVTATGASTTHRFYPAGVFTVNLTLTDGWDERVVQREVVVRPAGDGSGGGSPVPGLAPWLAVVAGCAAATWRRRRRAR